MANKVTGRVFISVNGERMRSKEGAKLMLGGAEREAVVGDDSIHGFTEKLTAPGIEFTMSHMADTNLKALSDLTDASVQFEADTGKVYVLRNAWCAKSIEMSKGEVSLVFNGLSCEEV